MLATVEIVEAIVVTTIMVRQRIIDKVMTTDVAIETTIIVRKKIIVFTGVYIVTHLVIATDHIDTGAMIAGNKKTIL
jgi:hypothetical protein